MSVTRTVQSSAHQPSYARFDFPLTLKGQQDLPVVGTKIVFISATDPNGNQALGAVVNVQIGKALGDPLPMQLNSDISAEGGFEFVRFTWSAQPGITATFLVSDDRHGAGLDMRAPPTKQLVTAGGGTQILASRVTVDTTAGGKVIDAGGNTVQSRTIKNLDPTQTIDIGPQGVAAGAGFPLKPQESVTLTGQNAPIYGIVPAGTAQVAVLVEQ